MQKRENSREFARFLFYLVPLLRVYEMQKKRGSEITENAHSLLQEHVEVDGAERRDKHPAELQKYIRIINNAFFKKFFLIRQLCFNISS